MSGTAHTADLTAVREDRRHLGPLAGKVIRTAGAAGVACLGLALVLALTDGGVRRFLFAYTTAFAYVLSLMLGGLFFVLVMHLTKAGWNITVRRAGELCGAAAPILAILFLPILGTVIAGSGVLFPWADPERAASDHLIAVKGAWFGRAFFTARWLVFFAVWTWLGRGYFKRSVEQDESGDPELTRRMETLSAPAMILFALTTTFASFDLLMSLDPHWYSTIFGVYFFSGSVVGFLAFAILVYRFLQRAGLLRRSVTVEHYHDLGKLLFAFIFFWGYIAFSQFMLIWYGNIPEETEWFQVRQHGSWVAVALALLFGHFLIPFPGLLSRHAKRRLGLLTFWAFWMLAAHYVDMYYIVMPNYDPQAAPLHVVDLLAWVGMLGLFTAAVTWIGRHCSLIPVKDPRLPEAVAFENT